MLTLVNRRFYSSLVYKCGNTVHYSPPDLSVVFSLLFVLVVCLVLLSLVAAAFLANKDAYRDGSRTIKLKINAK